MVRSWNRAMFSGCLLALLSCASCKSTPAPPPVDKYTRDETLQVTQVGSKRLNDKPKVEKQKRVVMHLRGSGRASYFLLTGPIKHGTKKIGGAPTTAPSAPAGTPTLMAVDAATAVVFSEDAETSNQFMSSFPFFYLFSGYAYVSGTAPAAQTEHVIAGSDSTKFIVEVDTMGTTTPDSYVHRVYVIEGTAEVQALGDGGVSLGRPIPVDALHYVEVRRSNGSWAMYGPAPYDTGANDFVPRVQQEAQNAGVQ